MSIHLDNRHIFYKSNIVKRILNMITALKLTLRLCNPLVKLCFFPAIKFEKGCFIINGKCKDVYIILKC